MVLESVDSTYLKITDVTNKIRSYFYASMQDVVKEDDKVIVGVRGINSTYSLNYITLLCSNIITPTFSNCDELYDWIIGEIANSYFCYPTADIVQATTTNSNTQLIDAIGKGDAREPREGRAYYFDATGNNKITFTNFDVGEDVEWIDENNAVQHTPLNASKEFTLTDTIVLSYSISGETFDCEEETGTQSVSTNGVIGTIGGTIATFHVTDSRKLYSQANDIGYLLSAIGQILPLNSGLAYVTKYEGEVPRNLKFVNGSAFDFNGSDNYINLGLKLYNLLTNQNFYIGNVFKVEFNGGTQQLSGVNGYSTNDKCKMAIANNDLNIFLQTSTSIVNYTYDLTTYEHQTIYVLAEINRVTDKLTIFINGDSVDEVTMGLIGDFNLGRQYGIGTSITPLNSYSQTPISSSFFGIGDKPIDLEKNLSLIPTDILINVPFVQKLGVAMNTVYDVNSNIAYTMQGTVTASQTVAQDVFFDKQVRGYTDDGTNYLPASNVNPTQDVLGNTLNHPPSEKGADENTYLQQYLAPKLIHASACTTWYDRTDPANVTAKKVQAKDVPANCNNQEYSNHVDTEVKDNLMYSEVKTEDEIIQIIKCYAKANGLPEGQCILTDSNGNILYSDTLMAILTKSC